jgi:hypothetical protein
MPVSGRTLAGLAGNGNGIAGRYFSARADNEGRYFLSTFDADGKIGYDIPLPDRGHGIALRPQSAHAVLVARRPGRFLLVFDAVTGEVFHNIESRPDRHFFGHAVYSADGRWLFTSENDYEQKRGVIGVRDATAAYRQTDEFSSGGIEPHDLHLCRNGRALVVANGGVLTHPDSGRAKLNLPTMSSSLAYLDTTSGRLLDEHRLAEEMHLLSIRHLAVSDSDQVCIAMQYEGDPADRPPLVALHRAGQESLRLLEPPTDVLAQMRNYCGSVCTDLSGDWMAVSSPQGNLITFWSTVSGKYAGNTRIADGCGIAAGARAGEFLLSSGGGGLYRYDVANAVTALIPGTDRPDTHWDNHMLKG